MKELIHPEDVLIIPNRDLQTIINLLQLPLEAEVDVIDPNNP